MPVYEYQCKACHREFEYQQRMTDPDKTACEACGGELERLISRTAFQLKGSGWYKDLYSSSKPEAKPSDGAAAKPAETKSTESKPASTDSGSNSSGSGTSSSSTPASTGSSSGSGSGSGSGSSGGGSGAKAAS